MLAYDGVWWCMVTVVCVLWLRCVEACVWCGVIVRMCSVCDAWGLWGGGVGGGGGWGVVVCVCVWWWWEGGRRVAGAG